MTKTLVERKREERQRKRAAGLVPVEVWIPPAKKSQLKKYVERIIKEQGYAKEKTS